MSNWINAKHVTFLGHGDKVLYIHFSGTVIIVMANAFDVDNLRNDILNHARSENSLIDIDFGAYREVLMVSTEEYFKNHHQG